MWTRREVICALAAASVVGCGGEKRDASRRFLTIATGGTGGVYYPLGGALAQVYTRQVPGVTASAQSTVASVFNVQAVQQGKADLAFTQGDVAYFAHSRGTASSPQPHDKLRGMVVLYSNVVQIVVRRDSEVERVDGLRGRRVGVGAPGSGTEVAARIIIEGHGLRYDEVRADFLSFSEVASELQNRTVDGGFMVASYPVSAITDVATSVHIRLLPVEREVATRIRGEYPFFRPIVIPGGTYRGQEADVETISVDNLLICREDLDDELVYRLTKTFFEALPELAKVHVAASQVQVEQGPATPIPLHPGAAHYYRELELLR